MLIRAVIMLAMLLTPALGVVAGGPALPGERGERVQVIADGCCPLCMPGAETACGCGCQAEAPKAPTIPREPRAPGQNETGRFFSGLTEPPLVRVLERDDAMPRRPRADRAEPSLTASHDEPRALLCRWIT